jgi:hypothetical protein
MEDWLRSEWEAFRLRMENADRKKQMEEEFGASFGSGDEALDPALESEWLNYMEEFERQFENAQRIPLRKYLGNPVVKPSAEVSDEALEAELDAFYDLLTDNNVALDCICEVPDRELYRFIVEEFLNEEIDDIRIPGSICHYTYEDYHPNDVYDVSEALRSLVHNLLKSDPEFQDYIFYDFCREKSFTANGQPQSWEELNERINGWFAMRPEVTATETEIDTCTVDGDDAHVEADVRWTTASSITTQGRASGWLTRSPYGGWDFVQVSIPGVPL